MKRVVIASLFLLILCCVASFGISEEDKTISIDKLPLGTPFVKCLDIINNEDAEFESYREDHPYICAAASAFGQKDSSASFLFDGDDKLCQINMDLWFDYVHEAYNAISSVYGGADIVYVADYLDNEEGDGYLDSGFPIYIVWKEENLICELEVYSSFNIDYSSSLLSGIKLNSDDTLSQLFDLRIYVPELFEEYSYLYE